MSEIVNLPKVSDALIQFWSKKYGKDETILLAEYISKLVQEIEFEKITYRFLPAIEFNLTEMCKSFPELTKKSLKKAYLSLKNQRIINTGTGKIENWVLIWFPNYESLLEEFYDFERK